MSTSSADENKRFEELNRKLEEKLSSVPKEFGNTVDSHLRATKKDAIDQLDKAIKDNNIPAATFYQAQVRWLKLALREY
jgi:ElaB/YqjD/DUF883 family membrane-anchored ribosome-binding protein